MGFIGYVCPSLFREIIQIHIVILTHLKIEMEGGIDEREGQNDRRKRGKEGDEEEKIV